MSFAEQTADLGPQLLHGGRMGNRLVFNAMYLTRRERDRPFGIDEGVQERLAAPIDDRNLHNTIAVGRTQARGFRIKKKYVQGSSS